MNSKLQMSDNFQHFIEHLEPNGKVMVEIDGELKGLFDNNIEPPLRLLMRDNIVAVQGAVFTNLFSSIGTPLSAGQSGIALYDGTNWHKAITTQASQLPGITPSSNQRFLQGVYTAPAGITFTQGRVIHNYTATNEATILNSVMARLTFPSAWTLVTNQTMTVTWALTM